MHSVYFITDFAYNPNAKNSLKVFELGDAFLSEFPNKKIGKEQQFASDRLINDLQQHYPNALFMQIYPSGLNLLDFSNNSATLTYDVKELFNDSTRMNAPSYPEIVKLIQEIVKHADKRTEKSRLLLLHIGHPKVFGIITADLQEYPHLKLINHVSSPLNEAFYNKRIFHYFARGNPIYPETFIFEFQRKDFAVEINAFIEKTQADYYVIKPTDGTRSEYVHIVPQKYLLNTVRQIQSREYDQEACDRFHMTGMIIQECFLSKQIKLNGESYYAKGRAIIRADFTNITVPPTLSFVTGYWQCAHTPCKDKVNDETVIANIAANPKGILEIEENDWQAIKALFGKHLPDILQSMCQNDHGYHFLFYKTVASQQENSTQLLRSKYVEAINQFLSQQVFIPQGPRWTEKIYYGWNTYIEDSVDQQIRKNFVIDIAGIDRFFNKNIIYNNQKNEAFVRNVANTLFYKRPHPLNQTVSLSCKLQYESNVTLRYLIIALIFVTIYTREFSSKTILSSIISTLFTCLIFRSGTYLHEHKIHNSYFFKKPHAVPVIASSSSSLNPEAMADNKEAVDAKQSNQLVFRH